MSGGPSPGFGAAARSRRRILVVDTDPGVRWSVERGLSNSGYDVHTASTVDQALRIAEQERVSAILMELLPEAGLTIKVLDSLLSSPGKPKLICTSIDGGPQTVIECMRHGAADFLMKPFSLGEIRSALAKILVPEAGGDAPLVEDMDADSLLVGVSPPMQELRGILRQVAKTNLNCLIRGESGSGKDMVAREIHRLSPRRDKPFIKVNCSALPAQLLESELFGFEKGAFTGATASRPGRFSLADHGIIFLDEIGEVHIDLQAKLLQVIEHKEFTKLGGRHSTHVDVQIIAATNADIEKKVREGSFRADLHFRLNELCIWVPPLSGRREDVPLLARHFIQKYNHLTGGAPLEISGEDLQSLCDRSFAGNVRELESTIKRWLVLGKRDRTPQESVPAAAPAPPQTAPEPTPEELLRILEEHQWNRRKAAETLGISYQAMRRRIEKYNLDVPR